MQEFHWSKVVFSHQTMEALIQLQLNDLIHTRIEEKRKLEVTNHEILVLSEEKTERKISVHLVTF